MLRLSAICWAIWSTRNKTCFEKIMVKGPNEIIFSACFFMNYWAGLYPDDAQEIIKKGVQSMIQAAIKLLGKPRETQGSRLLLTSGEEEDDQAQVDPDDQAGSMQTREKLEEGEA
jgi:hypothetical protein